MAVTNNKRQEELARSTQQVGSENPYAGLAGVSQNTANNLGNYQQGYNPGEQVTAAQQVLQNVQAQRPQAYSSKYQPQLDNIMAQIQNPGEFKYDFNGDNLFKAYADLFNQYAKQGMMDTMGQAAALTGGYGNSYAQFLGQQQYQQNMLPLYDKGLELYDRAYQRYQDRLGNLRDNYALMANADATDYARHRDTVGDWQNEEQQAYNRYMDAENMDYQKYMQELQYWTGLAQVENADYRSEQERQEAIRQYNEQFAEDVRRYDQDFAENQRRYDQDYAEDVRRYNQDFAENQRRYNQEWDHQMALEAAAAEAAAAAAAAPAYNPTNNEKHYYAVNGKYYEDNGNGIYKAVDKKDVQATRADESKDFINKGSYYKLRSH